jgi:hypothetical protein
LVEIYIAAKTASSIAPVDPAALRAEAEQAVAEAVAMVEALRKAGDLKAANAKYKRYRVAMMERGVRALSYADFIERRIETILRQVAMTGG